MRNEDLLNQELDALFAAYLEACPTPEASPGFMPQLWQKIDARRSANYSFGRWTSAFVTAAAAICMLLGVMQWHAPSQQTFYSQTYIEALLEENPPDGVGYFEALWTEDGGSNSQ